MAFRRILVVEDDAIIALEISERIRTMGYEVIDEMATTGEEAIQLAKDTLPDLILMDINLRGSIDGTVAARRITDFLDIPVVFITAYTDNETRRNAQSFLSYGYVVKPFNDQQLICAIDMAFANHALNLKLKEHDYWLDKTLKSIGDGVISTDREGKVTFINKVGKILLGLEGRKTVGKPLREIFIIQDSFGTPVNPVQICDCSITKEQEAPVQQEFICTGADGRCFPVLLTVTGLFNEMNESFGIVISFNDISDRKSAEQALRESEEKFRSLFEHISDAGFLTQLSGDGKENCIIEVNKAACSLLGYSRDELIGKDMADLNDRCCSPVYPDYLDRLYHDGSVTYEMILTAKDKKRPFVEIDAHTFLISGKKMAISLARPR
ncbi:MAG: PAS domain S-box protein [Deltaproteobacteria bacterium]|nr:PAS domain S-box protein [Deltaproteobacteria bacterium]MBN2734789.1 PAS domain S-box protein [Methanomicrobiaceae archaeon]